MAGTLRDAAEEAQLGGEQQGEPRVQGPTGAQGRLSLCIRLGKKVKCPPEICRHS